MFETLTTMARNAAARMKTAELDAQMATYGFRLAEPTTSDTRFYRLKNLGWGYDNFYISVTYTGLRYISMEIPKFGFAGIRLNARRNSQWHSYELQNGLTELASYGEQVTAAGALIANTAGAISIYQRAVQLNHQDGTPLHSFENYARLSYLCMSKFNPYHVHDVLNLGIPTADFESWLEDEDTIPFSLFTSMYTTVKA